MVASTIREDSDNRKATEFYVLSQQDQEFLRRYIPQSSKDIKLTKATERRLRKSQLYIGTCYVVTCVLIAALLSLVLDAEHKALFLVAYAWILFLLASLATAILTYLGIEKTQAMTMLQTILVASFHAVFLGVIVAQGCSEGIKPDNISEMKDELCKDRIAHFSAWLESAGK